MTPESKISILVVDDEVNIVEVVKSALVGEGYGIMATSSPVEALSLIAEHDFDLVLSDLRMEPSDGMEILRCAKEKDVNTQVVLITAYSTVETAVDAMKNGAHDYILKPFKLAELKLVVRRALEHRATLMENNQLRAIIKQKYDFGNIIGASALMQHVFERIRKVADTDSTILITGESGTGKELVSKALHVNSKRHDKPFVSINCGALTETLLESELFGHLKGSFTGAAGDKKGLFMAADGGTVFLDEIGLTSPALQIRLLRVLQEREIRPVGDTRDFRVNVRVIAATNEDMALKVKDGSFREDLFYRLSVIPINIPPLRERVDDIPLLVQHFLDKANVRLGRKYRADKQFIDLLASYAWPGNIRELENVIERAVALCDGVILRVEDIPDNILYYRRDEDKLNDARELHAVIEQSERVHIERVLKETSGNKKLAARILGIDLSSLYRKMEKLHIG